MRARHLQVVVTTTSSSARAHPHERLLTSWICIEVVGDTSPFLKRRPYARRKRSRYVASCADKPLYVIGLVNQTPTSPSAARMRMWWIAGLQSSVALRLALCLHYSIANNRVYVFPSKSLSTDANTDWHQKTSVNHVS